MGEPLLGHMEGRDHRENQRVLLRSFHAARCEAAAFRQGGDAITNGMRAGPGFQKIGVERVGTTPFAFRFAGREQSLGDSLSAEKARPDGGPDPAFIGVGSNLLDAEYRR